MLGFILFDSPAPFPPVSLWYNLVAVKIYLLFYPGILLHEQWSLITVTSTTHFNHPSIRKRKSRLWSQKKKTDIIFLVFFAALKLSAQCSRQADSQTLLNLTEVARRKFLSLTRSFAAPRDCRARMHFGREHLDVSQPLFFCLWRSALIGYLF